jgi:ubiquinone biosynthesis monooxygenase Coq7
VVIDNWILEFDWALRTVFISAPTTRAMPGSRMPDTLIDESQRREVAALMRVNHVGEVCAQALYRGQALTCRNPGLRRDLGQAAWEETEHLHWTETRLRELGGRKSLLNPLCYGGALAIGAMAGRAGDAWNLGFLAETERQVQVHLDGHLARLPAADQRSRSVLMQMRLDENGHAATAVKLGARRLPAFVRTAMAAAAKLVTMSAYYL